MFDPNLQLVEVGPTCISDYLPIPEVGIPFPLPKKRKVVRWVLYCTERLDDYNVELLDGGLTFVKKGSPLN